jgi:hypothetical protein
MTRISRGALRRRSFLRTTAGAVAAGAALLSGSASAQTDEDDEPAGYLSIVYDDSPAEDYEMFQVHQEYDAPGCIAACPGLMGSSDDWLTDEQLEETYDAGWEVMSHTLEHRALGEIPLVEDVEDGDTVIYPESNLLGRFEGDPLLVFDDESEVEATVADDGEDDQGPYIELEEPIDESFDAEEARVRYTDEFTERILADSQEQLEGIVGEGQVTGFVYTYERADGLVGELVPEYYEATPRADMVGLNPEHDPEPYDLSRRYMETDHMTEEEIEEFLDTVASEPDYGILAGHSQFDTMTTERIDFVLQEAEARDIEVVTVQEALDEFGVVEAPERTERDADETSETDDDEDGEDADTDPDADEDESEGLFDRILSLFRSLFD